MFRKFTWSLLAILATTQPTFAISNEWSPLHQGLVSHIESSESSSQNFYEKISFYISLETEPAENLTPSLQTTLSRQDQHHIEQTNLSNHDWMLGDVFTDPRSNTLSIVDNNDQYDFDVGVEYLEETWSIYGHYRKIDDTFTSALSTELESYGAGGTYEIAPGIIVQGNITFFEIDSKQKSNATSEPTRTEHIAILATYISF